VIYQISHLIDLIFTISKLYISDSSSNWLDDYVTFMQAISLIILKWMNYKVSSYCLKIF